MSAAELQPARPSDLLQAITHLSEKTEVPVQEIEAIYSQEVDRLAADARIKTFVGILALGRTRTILHQHKPHAAPG